MTKLELMKAVSEMEDSSYCPAGTIECRSLCPSGVKAACCMDNALRKVLALNEYELLLGAQEREEKAVVPIEREPDCKKVWRFKTLEECGGRIPGGFIEEMYHFLGTTLPESAIESAEAGNFHSIRGEIWSFSQEEITFDYPIE